MVNICNYRIIQRGADGFGRANFYGKCMEPGVIVARVMDETENTTVVPWQICERKGEEWSTVLTIPQGGLYRVEARLAPREYDTTGNTYDWAKLLACCYHVGVGDVFIMAGQSNMSGYARDSAYDPPELGVHLYNNAGEWVLVAHPLNSVPNPIYCNNDDNSGNAPGLAFGKRMHRALGVPVGLVSAARGGSSLFLWNPAEQDHCLFDAMVAKAEAVEDYAGIIWYQGCNEARDDEEFCTYGAKFQESVTLWRQRLGHKPIVTCQLNRHAHKGEGTDMWWGMVREAQRQAAHTLQDVYVVPTIDLTTVDGIHNTSGACVTLGERMANVMLHGHYGMPGTLAPDVKCVRRMDDCHALVEFMGSHTLRTMDHLACGMHVEDEEGLMPCEQVDVTMEGMVITTPRPMGKNPRFHAYWEREHATFFVRDIYGMPMLACYDVPIED